MNKLKTEPNKYCIGIPTLNRIDLLLPSLLLYAIDQPTVDIIIYDNGEQNIPDKISFLNSKLSLRKMYSCLNNITVLGGSGENVGVAGAWNILCEKAFEKYNYALLLNDDIYIKSTEYELNSLTDYMSENNVDFFSCERDKYDFSVFMISKRCFNAVGAFDENLVPAYLEDCDYLYRMNILARNGFIKHDCVPALNPTMFRRSSTLEMEPELIDGYKDLNLRYYEKKWGGGVGDEKFIEPFGTKK